MDRAQAGGKRLYSDQGVFGEVFGEQEIWRSWLRERGGGDDWSASKDTKMVLEEFEYHVGLDYAQQLFMPTMFAADDGIMVQLNNKSYIESESAAFGISPIRLRGVPDDIRKSRLPLLDVVPDDKLDGINWGSIPLYADLFSEAVPVVLHHNAQANEARERRVWWWDLTWYFPYLRDLVEEHLTRATLKTLAHVATKDTKRKFVVFWPPNRDSGKRKVLEFRKDRVKTGLPEMNFSRLCRSPGDKGNTEYKWYLEVFRDGKGPLSEVY